MERWEITEVNGGFDATYYDAGNYGLIGIWRATFAELLQAMAGYDFHGEILTG